MTKKKQKKQKYYLYYNVSKSVGTMSKDETSWGKTRVRQHMSLKEMKKSVKEICKTINKTIDAIGFEDVSVTINKGVNAYEENEAILSIFMASPDLNVRWHWYLSISVEKD